MKTNTIYKADESLQDIEIILENKKFLLLGNNGEKRELQLYEQYINRDKKEVLPVFLGLGFCHAIEKFLDNTENSLPLCIIDKEDFIDIPEYNDLVKKIISNPRVFFIQEKDNNKALAALTAWQSKHKNLPLFPLVNTQYLRIDSGYYKDIQEKLHASFKFDFWSKVRKKRFTAENPKILLITSKYFLMGELVRACEISNIEHKLLILEDEKMLKEEFVRTLLEEVAQFQPDCVLTMNHLGVDREGVLTDLLARLELPLVSWFVDNPHLVLSSYPKLSCDWLTIFTYDSDNIPSLNQAGYDYVYYLPLGTDPERFNPKNHQKPFDKKWKSNISFVGNSMITKVSSALGRADIPNELLKEFEKIATAFIKSKSHSVLTCLEESFQELMPFYNALPTIENKLAFETAITWEATRIYRFNCVSKIFDYNPLIVGDSAWLDAMNDYEKTQNKKVNFNYFDTLSYYSELPQFYCHSKINFNTTSQQMKNAVNQRIFDVPATNSFVITDWRSQMDNLLESGKEIVSYKSTEEIPELIKFYLKNEQNRMKIVEAGRKRIISSHTWQHRLNTIIETVKKRYA